MSIAQQALRALAYFSVFSHPLRADEVAHFCGQKGIELREVEEALFLLEKAGSVRRSGAFFQMAGQADWSKERLKANQMAEAALPVARKRAALIGSFPFVRAVLVSGSLSKGCMKPGGDVDFFVVTAPGRLWVARTLLILFKKICLLNSHRFFCLNYFVDSEHLEIAEKNQFTAVETVTLLPMWGRAGCAAFFKANRWAWEGFCPNFPKKNLDTVPEQPSRFVKKIVERMLGGRLGEWLDRAALNATVRYWKKKFKDLPPEDFSVALKSKRGVSKHHPRDFQARVLAKFAENIEKLSVPSLLEKHNFADGSQGT
jgi:hypothetical protein